MRLPNGPFGTAEMLEPVRRFPLPALFAVLATLVNWDVINGWGGTDGGRIALSVYLDAAFLWSWAAALWAETRGERGSGLLVGMAGALLLALVLRVDLALIQLLSNTSSDRAPFTVSHFFLLGALALAPSLAPFLFRRISQSAFWQYNHTWLVGLLAAWVGSLLAVAGIAAILATAALVFEKIVPSWIYERVWLLSTTLILPWIWLLLSPRNFREEAKTGAAQEFTSRAIGLLVIYILVPVMLVLSALLVAYVVKVIAEGSTLTARLGLTSAVYGTGVIVVGLLAYPQRADTPLVRLFWRIRPFLLIAPTVLLFPALWVRVAEYGWTPERYFALIVGLWMVGVLLIGLAGSRSREEDMRLVPGLAALLLAVTAFGPWGVGDVSARSQYARLEALLTAKGLLVDGRWRVMPGPIPWVRGNRGRHDETGPIVLVGDNDREIAQSALNVLSLTGRLGWLQPWFESQPDDPFTKQAANTQPLTAIERKMGFDAYLFGAKPLLSTRIVFGRSGAARIALPGMSGLLVGPFGLSTLQTQQTEVTPMGQLRLALRDKQLFLELGPTPIGRFDLAPLLEQQTNAGQTAGMALMLDAADGSSQAKLALTYLTVTTSGSRTEIYLTVYVLLPSPPQ